MAEKETKLCSEGCEEMTDNEVIKALEVCAYSDDCLKECPLFNYKAGCIRKLTASALEIIKRHQSDVEPVRHGRWISLDDYFEDAQCSECGDALVIGDCSFNDFCECYKYCPNCGAKMVGGEGE